MSSSELEVAIEVFASHPDYQFSFVWEDERIFRRKVISLYDMYQHYWELTQRTALDVDSEYVRKIMCEYMDNFISACAEVIRYISRKDFFLLIDTILWQIGVDQAVTMGFRVEMGNAIGMFNAFDNFQEKCERLTFRYLHELNLLFLEFVRMVKDTLPPEPDELMLVQLLEPPCESKRMKMLRLERLLRQPTSCYSFQMLNDMCLNVVSEHRDTSMKAFFKMTMFRSPDSLRLYKRFLSLNRSRINELLNHIERIEESADDHIEQQITLEDFINEFPARFPNSHARPSRLDGHLSVNPLNYLILARPFRRHCG